MCSGRARQVVASSGGFVSGDCLDEELQPGPKRRFAVEAEHGMQEQQMRTCAFDGRNCADAPQAVSAFFFPRTPQAQDLVKRTMESTIAELKERQGSRHHFPISGNLYMYRYLQPFAEDTGLFQESLSCFVSMGLNFIIVCQFFGPMIVIASALCKISFGSANQMYLALERFHFEFGSDTKGVSYIGQNFLALFFLILFIMNGMTSLQRDREETEKLIELDEFFEQEAEERQLRKPRKCWLWLGACMNSFCFIASSVAMCLLFVIADEGPKGVLFDAFGVTFLYNLDDIGGDLAFLDEVWDEDLMGDMYGDLVDAERLLEDHAVKRKARCTPDNLYQIAWWVTRLMLYVLPFAFAFVDMAPKEDRRLSDGVDAEHIRLSQITVGELLRLI